MTRFSFFFCFSILIFIANPFIFNAQATTSHPKSKTLKTSTACCSSLTDVCKENKRYTTNKSQISYGKKEKPANVSTSRKKGNYFSITIS